MCDQDLFCSQPTSLSDDTIYPRSPSTKAQEEQQQQQQKGHRIVLSTKDVKMTKHIRKQKSLSSSNSNSNINGNSTALRNLSAMGFSAYGLQGSIDPNHLSATAQGSRGSSGPVEQRDHPGSSSHSAGVTRSLSQYGRSVSLLSRLKHPNVGSFESPTASPTSSESSSRDNRSERTLAHSASSGSIRIYPQQQNSQQQPHQPHPHGPLVKLLPPQDSPSSVNSGDSKKRRGGRKSGSGFISQFLRGQSKHSPQASLSSPDHQAAASAVSHFVRSPGTPGSHASVDSESVRSRSPASESIDSGVDQPYGAHQEPPSDSSYSTYYGEGRSEPASADRVDADEQASGHAVVQQHDYAPPQWYGDNGGSMQDSMQMAGNNQFVSALPIYQPIDMSRLEGDPGPSSSADGYPRATRPMLPDARMLAPMASLADVFRSPNLNEFNTLSNRELRFAVENHMLVDQHRYLIRDLGHARSAISALKQVVQAKEERLEHYESANMELQQRVALLESILNAEQRQQLACLPYAYSVFQTTISSASSSSAAAAAALQPGSVVLGLSREGPDKAPGQNTDDVDDGMAPDRQGGKAEDADQRRVNRPLSGYATGYSFSDKPLHHLPRVFSGDYSAADVHAMETSVGVLANAIKSMPRDEHSVADIIASKMAGEDHSEQQPPQRKQDGEEDDAEGRDESKHKKSRSKCKQEAAVSSSPVDQKRRSRFLSALRLSGFGSSSQGAAVSDSDNDEAGHGGRQNRRSVSLGNGAPFARQHQSHEDTSGSKEASAKQRPGMAVPKRVGSEPSESLASSCPLLAAPGFADCKARDGRLSARRQISSESIGSSAASSSVIGRYPAGLGLGGSVNGSAEGSVRASSNSSQSSAGNGAVVGKSRRSRIAHRLSFTPQPRRSTSAPSRPQSMQVSRRRSWLSRLFDSGDEDTGRLSVAGSAAGASEVDDATDDEGKSVGRARRRRVMTQSSDEVSRYLGRLGLEDDPAHLRTCGVLGRSGVLEDVIDVSGEDEERASRPSLSVAEIRQQTLDALNGTLRASRDQDSCPRNARVSSLPQQKPTGSLVGGLESDECFMAGDHGSGRWRQRESAVPTIRRLSAQSTSSAASATASSLGLGVMSGRRDSDGSHDVGSASPVSSSSAAQYAAGIPRRASSDQPHARNMPSGVAASTVVAVDGGGDSGSSGKKWAPAFWAPPPLPFHAASPGAAAGSPGTTNIWTCEDGADGIDNPSSIGSRLSEDGRYRSPRGSISVSSRSAGSGDSNGNAATGSGSGNSPWELVKLPAETRAFPLSPPSRSRPGTPPSHGLGFFEEPPVPDSDELTMAARRSLSLRMSRNAFLQAEPLPESDDTADVLPLAALGEHTRGGLKKTAYSGGGLVQSKYGGLSKGEAEDGGGHAPKRKSLLWQFGSRSLSSSSSSSSSAAAASKVLGGVALAKNNVGGYRPSDISASTNISSDAGAGAGSRSVESASVAFSGAASEDCVSRGGVNSSTAVATTAASAGSENSNRVKKWWSAVLG